MPLKEYWKKRNFRRTPEPQRNKKKSGKKLIYVVQKHAASHLHYDFRLEWQGVLKSWAVPKGPGSVGDKRLAVQVEDHPFAYADFSGVIPEGEYGAGTVEIWDKGYWYPNENLNEALKKGKLEFQLAGKRLNGYWMLVRMKGKAIEPAKNWLLIKKATIKKSTPPLAATAPATALDQISGAKKTAFPRSFHPELGKLGKTPTGKNWLHETKFDGYRIISFLTRNKAMLLARSGKDWSDKFPGILQALKKAPFRNTIFDGELVVLDSQGIPRFQLLQNFLEHQENQRLIYYIFDLPYYQGYDLSQIPLLERKKILKAVLQRWSHPNIRYSEHIQGNGESVFAEACAYGMEGIVSKRAESHYQQRRTADWIKSKCLQQQEFVVGGYTQPAGSREYFGSLLLGYYKGNKLIYCGHVGTGFSEKDLKALYSLFQAQKKSPFANLAKLKNTHWIKPALVVAINYYEWTDDGILRQAVYQGLRRDKKPKEVIQESNNSNKQSSVNPKRAVVSRKRLRKNRTVEEETVVGIQITHPAKLLYDQPDINKITLVKFYQTIAPFILPHIIDRPLTLLRCPNGIAEECFYQKHVDSRSLKELKAVEVPGNKAQYLTIKNRAGLMTLIQMNVIEIHPWGSKINHLDKPDRLIFDLDPDVHVPWKAVIAAAFLLRDYLKKANLKSFVKLTGGKGLHVIVPLTPHDNWETVKAFASAMAELMAQEFPDKYIAKMTKARRHNKIYIDYLRNMQEATAIAPYCLRKHKDAPMAMPISWADLPKTKSAQQFNFNNVLRYLKRRKTDPWKDFFKIKQKIRRSAIPADLSRWGILKGENRDFTP